MICALILIPLLGAAAIKLCRSFEANRSGLFLIGFCALELALSVVALTHDLQGKTLPCICPLSAIWAFAFGLTAFAACTARSLRLCGLRPRC